MKKILVPTDFSECANYATEVAASIARKTGARLYLLHVVNMPTYSDNYTMRDEYQDVGEGLYVLKMTKKRFKEQLEQPYLKDVNVVEVLQFDNVYETITQQAKEHEIDLIVMGSHGTSGLSEVFIGSNTEKVVRLADSPVLTVKKQLKDFQLKNVIFASSFYGEVAANFERIKDFLRIFDPTIHLLKVITPDRFEKTGKSKKIMEDFAKQFNLKNYTINIYNDETVESGILEFADEVDADLLSMTTHGRTGLSHLINGSLTEDVVNHSSRPVLSLKLKEEDVKYGVIFPE